MKVPASFAAAIGTFSPRTFVEDASAQVTVREDASVYTVNATMAGSQPAAVAIIVLSDYDQIPRFILDVHASHVIEQGQLSQPRHSWTRPTLVRRLLSVRACALAS